MRHQNCLTLRAPIALSVHPSVHINLANVMSTYTRGGAAFYLPFAKQLQLPNRRGMEH